MRHILFYMLIVLTAMRGWVGDVMAMSMALDTVDQIVITEQNDSAHKAAQYTHPCHSTLIDVNASASADSSDLSTLSQTKNTCFSCQVCHLNAMIDVTAHASAPRPPTNTPECMAATWSSAILAQSIRPPIS